MSVTRVALRLAVRDMMRERRRYGLIASLIAIPLAGLAAGFVLLQNPVMPSFSNRGVTAGAEGGVVILLLAFIAALVCLLTGSAFLVAAKARQQSLAVIASIGTSRTKLITISSLTGPLIGLLGGVCGVLVGTGIGWILITATGPTPGQVSVPIMVGLVLFAVLLGWVAALPPAITASRTDVVLALQNSTLPASRPRHAVLSAALTASGVVVAFGAGSLMILRQQSEEGSPPWSTALTGPAHFLAVLLMLAGAITATPYLTACLARHGRQWGIAAQLAFRDADRNRTRHLPVIAAIMGTTFLAVFILCAQSTSDSTTRTTYRYLMTPGGVQAALISYPGDQRTPLGPTLEPGTDPTVLAQQVSTAFSESLPIDRLTIIQTPKPLSEGSTLTPPSPVITPATNQCDSRLVGNDRFTPLAPDPLCRDWYTAGTSNGSIPAALIIGDTSTLATILDRDPSQAAQTALAGGKAVSLHPLLLNAGGSVELDLTLYAEGGSASVAIAAITENTPEVIPFGVIISPETAEKLGLTSEKSQILATTTRVPTANETVEVNQRLADIAGTSNLFTYLETGPLTDSATPWLVLLLSGSIVIAASLVALTLSRTEGRQDFHTLTAIGAPHRTLRATAAWQGLFVTGIGVWAGIAVGLLAATSMNLPGSGSVFSAPWGALAALAIATPIATATYGWARSRQKDESRA